MITKLVSGSLEVGNSAAQTGPLVVGKGLLQSHESDDRIAPAASDLIGMLHVLRMGRGVYWQLFFALILIIASAAAVMISARVLGELVNKLRQVASVDSLGALGAVFLALEGLSVGCQYFGRVILARATIEITYKIRSELFAKMQRLPISYFDTQPLGRTITRLTSDVEGIETFFNGTLSRVLIATINIVTVLAAMIVTDLRFGSMIICVCLPALFFSVAMRRPVVFWLRTYKQRSAHLNAKLAEYLNGLPVIRIFGLEIWSQRQFDAAAESLLKAGISTLNWNSFIRPMAVFLCSLPTLLVLWLGGEQVLAGTMQLGLLVAFVRYSERFVSPIRVISTEIQNIQEAVVSSERVRRMLLEDEELDTLGPDGYLRPEVRGEVEFRDVWMSYKPGVPVLKGVSFHIRSGMTVGLVGTTGSGKTSTVNLIPRLYPLERGEILLDGINITKISRPFLRQQLGCVSQDVIIFAGSLRDNLLASDVQLKLTDEAIITAAKRTGLIEFISNVEQGLDYQIVEGGENLSSGERQLVAFTRMLLRNPQILILDEATANIDEHCEQLIQNATFEVMRGRTCFIIAHRLSTIIHCDLILVFANGQVIEQGTHGELMQAAGYYAQLASKQITNILV